MMSISKDSVVKDLLMKVSECEDGTKTSTCELLESVGYEVDQ